jgi:hypothetical protein
LCCALRLAKEKNSKRQFFKGKLGRFGKAGELNQRRAHLRALLSNVCHNYNTRARGAHSQHTSSTFNHLNCFLFVYKVLSARAGKAKCCSLSPLEREKGNGGARCTHTAWKIYSFFFCQLVMNKYETEGAGTL